MCVCVYFTDMISIMCLLEWFCPTMVVAQLLSQYFETLKIQLEIYIANYLLRHSPERNWTYQISYAESV